MKTEWTNGRHKLRFTPPDILCVDILGPIVVEEAKESVRIIEEDLFPVVGKVFYFINLVESPGLNPEVRKYFGSIHPPFKGVVIIGGSPMMRRVSNIATRAMDLMHATSTPMRMVETFEEGCEWAKGVRGAEQARAARR